MGVEDDAEVEEEGDKGLSSEGEQEDAGVEVSVLFHASPNTRIQFHWSPLKRTRIDESRQLVQKVQSGRDENYREMENQL